MEVSLTFHIKLFHPFQVGDEVTDLDHILQGFLDDILETLKSQEGKTMNVQNIINEFVCNVTFTLVSMFYLER